MREECLKTCCEAMYEALDSQDRKKPRFVIHTMVSNKTAHTRLAVILYSGEFRERGVHVNYCPFCGARLIDHCGVDLREPRGKQCNYPKIHNARHGWNVTNEKKTEPELEPSTD